MNKARIVSLVSGAFALAIGLVAQTASAVCCSAPICQSNTPPLLCNYCNPSCSVDDDTSTAQAIEGVYDEAAGLCYVATSAR